MNIALYQGTSLVSLAIRFLTRSKYSHAAFLFDGPACRTAQRLRELAPGSMSRLHFSNQGAVVEAWKGGVQNSTSLSSLHSRGTKVDIFELTEWLTEAEREELVQFCAHIVGRKYDYFNVIRFVTKHPGREDKERIFCSEAVRKGFRSIGHALLNNVRDCEVPPGWLAMSPQLRHIKTITTR